MKLRRTFVLALAFALASFAGTAIGQPDAPTDAQIEQAKTAFKEGKKLFEAKKYADAADKFKESYRLSKRPALLYNVALALDEGKQRDPALFYYRKFLADAPKDDPQRSLAGKRVKELEKELGPDAGKSDVDKIDTGGPDAPVKPEVVKPETPKKLKLKPPGTYDAKDFQHQLVEEAPPGKPLDLTASVPTDSGFIVTLFYRGAKDAQFTPVQMRWRYKELVGRIPAAKMAGTSVQYYLEVKDQAGTQVTKVAKAASPNVVFLEAKASPRFYPDFEGGGGGGGGGGGAVSTGAGNGHGGNEGGAGIDNEDPLKKDLKENPLDPRAKRVAERPIDDPTQPPGGGGPGGNGFLDAGSKKFKYTKWGTTIVGGGLLATAVIFYVRAGNAASTIEADAENCGAPPCRPWDDYLRDAESTGKSSETIYKVSLGFGVAITAIAGYYWVKDLRHHGPPPKEKSNARGKARKRSFIATPAIGDGMFGGAAAVEF